MDNTWAWVTVLFISIMSLTAIYSLVIIATIRSLHEVHYKQLKLVKSTSLLELEERETVHPSSNHIKESIKAAYRNRNDDESN